MGVFLVRHSVALARRKWHGPDDERPLTPRGVLQAELLSETLAGYELQRIYSSPSVRCVETVRPLAKNRHLDVTECPDLGEGSTHLALALVRAHATMPAVLCSHGDVIPWVLEQLVRRDGVDLGPDPKCAKGSAWVLEFDAERCVSATYLAPSA